MGNSCPAEGCTNEKQIKHQYATGWKSALTGLRKLIREHTEDTGATPDAEQVLAFVMVLESVTGEEK